MDHERPAVDSSSGAANTSATSHAETSTQKTADVSSPSNEYEYVLHKFHHHEQRQRPQHTSPAADVSAVFLFVYLKIELQ